MLVGYMRVSTDGDRQVMDLQRDALLAAGIDERHLFEDRASGSRGDRAGLAKTLAFIRAGDCLVVWKLDRLGRSLPHLLTTVTDLKARGIAFRSLTEQMDTTTAQGEQAFYARAVGNVDAFLIALDDSAKYDSPNYARFQERYDRFIYVDRIVVRASARGKHLAKRLYADLASRAVEAGHRMIACEINSDPPNPASDAFHARIGFVPVGVAAIHGGAKTVRYLVRHLPDAAGTGDVNGQDQT